MKVDTGLRYHYLREKVTSDEMTSRSLHIQFYCAIAGAATEKHWSQGVVFTVGAAAITDQLDVVCCGTNGNHVLLASNALLLERMLWDPGGI